MLNYPMPNCCTAIVITKIPYNEELRSQKSKDVFIKEMRQIIKKYDANKYKLLLITTTNRQSIAADIIRKHFKFRGNLIPSRTDLHETTLQLHYYIYR